MREVPNSWNLKQPAVHRSSWENLFETTSTAFVHQIKKKQNSYWPETQARWKQPTINDDLCLGNHGQKFPLVSLTFPLEKKGTMQQTRLVSLCDHLQGQLFLLRVPTLIRIRASCSTHEVGTALTGALEHSASVPPRQQVTGVYCKKQDWKLQGSPSSSALSWGCEITLRPANTVRGSSQRKPRDVTLGAGGGVGGRRAWSVTGFRKTRCRKSLWPSFPASLLSSLWAQSLTRPLRGWSEYYIWWPQLLTPRGTGSRFIRLSKCPTGEVHEEIHIGDGRLNFTRCPGPGSPNPQVIHPSHAEITLLTKDLSVLKGVTKVTKGQTQTDKTEMSSSTTVWGI